MRKAGDSGGLKRADGWHMQEVWKMLSDKTIWEVLGDPEREIQPDLLRLLLIEMFTRIKRLEQLNFALQSVIVQQGIVDPELYQYFLKESKHYLDRRDEEKAAQSEVWRKSGLSFAELVNFTLRGSFAPAKEPTGEDKINV